ncbi:hypothetical protein GCK72_019858 [Caenorhabditis remanei]|uniref:Seven TM Receptor n=1 Tax=Caenorhabditis remanei TaxID=31234 RepID=A0A6A5GFP0_CAERE|nr:hypothetical protein GCK72_019858 [Caenorhabditis remanei]KAF1753302.1 hypothetical protein GCK72_019858 [Caenorhabditis remanei]
MIVVLRKSPKSLGSYKYLMVFMSISELCYALIDILLKPEVILNGSFWTVGTNSTRTILPLWLAYPLVRSEVQEVNWNNMNGLILMSSIVALSLITMIYFAVKAHKAIRELASSCENLSSLAQSLQRQLFYSLVIQTIIPMILIHVPTTFIVVSSLLGVGKQLYGDVIIVTIGLFPAIDPLPSLIIIKPYREAIKNFLLFKKPSSTIRPDDTKFSNVISRAVFT